MVIKFKIINWMLYLNNLPFLICRILKHSKEYQESNLMGHIDLKNKKVLWGNQNQGRNQGMIRVCCIQVEKTMAFRLFLEGWGVAVAMDCLISSWELMWLDIVWMNWWNGGDQEVQYLSPLIRRASAISEGKRVTLLACWVQRLASSRRPITADSVASWRHSRAWWLNLRTSLSAFLFSRPRALTMALTELSRKYLCDGRGLFGWGVRWFSDTFWFLWVRLCRVWIFSSWLRWRRVRIFWRLFVSEGFSSWVSHFFWRRLWSEAYES